MYKNIEILDKTKHSTMKFETVDASIVAQNIGIVPLGINEVLDMSSIAPVLISAGENAEFIAFTGISKEITIYNRTNNYIPSFISAYPFVNIVVKDENNNKNTVVAVNNNDAFVGDTKTNAIFTEDGKLEKIANSKIELLRALNSQRDISKRIINEFKEKDLLLKKDFKVKTDKEEVTLLKEFYVINREKLIELEDATLALWAKKGWMGIIDAHIKSLNNFQKIVTA
jgi:hypothetical protein